MSMNLHDAVGGDGLFDIQGKAFGSITTLNAFRGTTMPAAVEAVLDQLNQVESIPVSYEQAGSTLPSALTGWQSSAGGLAQSLATFCQSLLLAFVSEDTIQIDTSLTAALEYLIDQMETDGDYVAPNVVAGTLTESAGNVGDTAVTWTLIDGLGKACQLAYAETLTLTVAANPSPTQPSILCVGQAKLSAWDPEWAQGSGANCRLSATNPAASLVVNGDFEDSTYDDVPDSWIVAVGSPGTTIGLSDPETQTVAISGTPTGGSYVLLHTDRTGQVRATTAIAYNASAGTVQTALRTIEELGSVTVTSTGTSPDYTHTITFTGVGGNITQLTSINLLTGGTPSIAHATTSAGDASDYRGRSLKLIGNSATLQALYASLGSLKIQTVYFCHMRLRRSGTATGAVLKAAVVQEIGGTALDDDEGNANELEIDAAALSDSASESIWFSFRLPATAILPVYLRVAATTAIPTGATIYVDEVAVAAGTRPYSGGPFLAAFSGVTPSAADDSWTLAISNSHDGAWQDFYNRAFQMAEKDLLLPTSGSNLIPDTDVYPA